MNRVVSALRTILLASLTLCAASLRAAEPVRLPTPPKSKGQAFRSKMSILYRPCDKKETSTLRLNVTTTVTEVRPNGEFGQKIAVESDGRKGSDYEAWRGANSRPICVSVGTGDADGQGINLAMWYLRDLVRPEKPVRPGDTWVTEADNPLRSGPKLKITTRFVGIENNTGQKRLRFQQTTPGVLLDAQRSASDATDFWLDVKTGAVLQMKKRLSLKLGKAQGDLFEVDERAEALSER